MIFTVYTLNSIKQDKNIFHCTEICVICRGVNLKYISHPAMFYQCILIGIVSKLGDENENENENLVVSIPVKCVMLCIFQEIILRKHPVQNC